MQLRVRSESAFPAGMTVHANELYIAFRGDRLQPYTIKVYSFGGQVIRSFTVPSSHTELKRGAVELYSSRDRLYLSETVPAGHEAQSEIFVLSRGHAVGKDRVRRSRAVPYMCIFDDKLLLTKMTSQTNPDDDDSMSATKWSRSELKPV